MIQSAANKKVIIADDDPAALRMLAALLSSAGYDVHTAHDGLEAVSLLRSERANMLVTDWEMPGLDGMQLCRKLRAEMPREELFVLMLTIRTDPDDMLAALENGADDFMSKPINGGELLARLQAGSRVLELRRQLQQARASAQANMHALASRADEIAATRDVAVFALAALAESRDPETGAHLERLRSYSQILAEELHRQGPYRDQIDERFLEDLYRSSPLHDVGKVGIPDAILRKPGKLTPAEFDIMKLHTSIGADALEKAMRHSGGGGFLAMAVDIARYHHERFDGAGYPKGLKGYAIPLPARIVALADVYDALTSVRCYKEAYPPELAREMILEQEGKHFDPAVVEAFLARFVDFLEVREAIESSAVESPQPIVFQAV